MVHAYACQETAATIRPLSLRDKPCESPINRTHAPALIPPNDA